MAAAATRGPYAPSSFTRRVLPARRGGTSPLLLYPSAEGPFGEPKDARSPRQYPIDPLPVGEGLANRTKWWYLCTIEAHAGKLIFLAE